MEQNNVNKNAPVEQDFNEIVKIRRKKLANLKICKLFYCSGSKHLILL